LNQNPSFMARQIVDEVVSAVQKDVKESDNKENEHANMTIATDTIITRIEGSPSKRAKCEQEKVQEEDTFLGEIPLNDAGVPSEMIVVQPEDTIISLKSEESKDERASNESGQSKRQNGEKEREGEMIVIEVECPSNATPDDSPNEILKDGNILASDTGNRAVKVDKTNSAQLPKKSTIPRMVKKIDSEDKESTLPAIGGRHKSRRFEGSSYNKKKFTAEPLSLPPIEKTTLTVEKRVKITTPQISTRSTKEAEDADLDCLSARNIEEITGGWGGSERHLELYDDDDIPMRVALPRTLTLPYKLTDRRLYSIARRFERIHSYQRYPRDIYYYERYGLDPDFSDL
ncbi:hypothetical protein PMAYCL1PPCAC_04452, partial [Pristionchus mayeri]